MAIDPQIYQEIKSRLLKQFDFKENKNWLNQGKCPQCSKKELWTNAQNPWIIKCSRENNCNFEETAKNLYPDLFENFNKRYPKSEQDPNATAKAYMQFHRGFDISKIKDFFQQGEFWHEDAVKGTATVRFIINNDPNLYMERFIEPVKIKSKSGDITIRNQTFKGAWGGHVWQPPKQKIKTGDEIWLTEACIDTISLILSGKKSVAILSAQKYPDIFLKKLPKDIKLIWALDNDKCGKKYIKSFAARAEKDGFKYVSAALIPSKNTLNKIDWNNAFQNELINDWFFDKCRHLGELLLAKSTFEKSFLIFQNSKISNFAFDFNYKTYWFSLNEKIFAQNQEREKAENSEITDDELIAKSMLGATKVAQISNCSFDFLYFQENTDTNENLYHIKIKNNFGQFYQDAFSSAHLSNPQMFDQRISNISPFATFSGKNHQLNFIKNNQQGKIPIVSAIDFIGYSHKFKSYIFNNLAISNGKIYRPNDHGYFNIDKIAVKPQSSSVVLNFGQKSQYYQNWINEIDQTYGTKGLITIMFFIGTLFAEQIRANQESFPFLEIMGDANAGKTTLIQILWKAMGRDNYEGFDPHTSTPAARRRNMTKVSNLPISLIEGDKENDSKYAKFDFSELKSLYNGNPAVSRGIKNMGNDTYEPPFRASILISQNVPISGNEAMITRIVQMRFTNKHFNAESQKIVENLSRLKSEELSYFLVKICCAEKKILDAFYKSVPIFQAKLLDHPKIKNTRVAKCHGQFMALAFASADLLNLSLDQKQRISDELTNMAINRHQDILSDNKIISEFWSIFDYLDGFTEVNNSNDPENFIAVNLNQFIKIANENKQNPPIRSEIFKYLKQSKTHQYIGQKAVQIKQTNSQYMDGVKPCQLKCWIFKRK